MSTRSRAWFDDHGEVLAFVRALDGANELDSIDAALRIVEKPWKWEREYEAWIAAARPGKFAITGLS